MRGLRERFTSSVYRGTGEAILLLEEHPSLDVEDIVFSACTRNFAYDPQSEGHRAEYALRLLQASPRPDKIIARIRRSLAQRRQANWDLVHLFALCGLLYSRGMADLKSAAMRCYARLVDPWDDAGCGEELACAFGANGLLQAASTRGQFLREHPDLCEDDELLRAYCEMHPTEDARKILVDGARESDAIASFLARVDAHWSNRKEEIRTYNGDLEFFRSQIESIGLAVRVFARTNEDRAIAEALIADFLLEKDPVRQKKYARILGRYKIHGGMEQLLALLPGCDEREERDVLQALSHFTDKRIRELAMKGIGSDPQPGNYLLLLKMNYQPGDARLLTRLVRSRSNPEAVHDLVDLIDIYQHNIVEECAPPLLALYDELTCGLHRLKVVKALNQAGYLNERIRTEIRLDSLDKLREFSR